MSLFLDEIILGPLNEQDMLAPLLPDIVVEPLASQDIALRSADTGRETTLRLALDDSPSGSSAQKNNSKLVKFPVKDGGGLPFDPGNNDSVLVLGTSGDDVIPGTPDNAEIYGYEGNDEIKGGAGNDTIFGGEGVDDIWGGEGNDLLEGGQGTDWLFGEEDHDILRGGEGSDWVAGGWGNDTVQGGAGDDTLYGGGDDDSLDGGEGNDQIGDSSGNNYLDGGAGDDTLWGAGTVYGGTGNDSLEAFGSNTTLHGDSGNDTLLGASMNFDLLVGGSGVDRYDGRGGGDIYQSAADGAQDTFVVHHYDAGNPVDIHGFQLMNDPTDTTHDIIELNLYQDFYIIEHVNAVGVADQVDTLIKGFASGDTLAVVVDVEIPILPDNPYITVV